MDRRICNALLGLTLEAVGLYKGKPIINTVTGEAAHIVFSFCLGRERSLTGEFKIIPVGKVDMTLP